MQCFHILFVLKNLAVWCCGNCSFLYRLRCVGMLVKYVWKCLLQLCPFKVNDIMIYK